MNDFKRNSARMEHVYKTYSEGLFAIALGLTNNKEDAEDLMSHSFEMLWKHKDIGLMEMEAIWGFLCKTAKYKFITDWRKDNSEKKYLNSPEAKVLQQFDHAWDVEKSLSEYFKDLLEEIKKLPKRQGEVLRLFYIDDKSAQEISEQLNISVNTVYNTLSDLRKKLRKKMEDRGIQ